MAALGLQSAGWGVIGVSMGTAGLITAAVCCCSGDYERRPKLFVTCSEKVPNVLVVFQFITPTSIFH